MGLFGYKKNKDLDEVTKACVFTGKIEEHCAILSATFLVIVFISLMVGVSSCGSSSGGDGSSEDALTDRTTTLAYNPVLETWIAVVVEDITPTGSTSIDEIVIKLDKDEPIKEISLKQVLLVDSYSSDDVLKTDAELKIVGGSASGGSGDIRICNLLFLDVDSEDFEVVDTDVVRLDLVNVSAESDFELQITPVNTIRCGRGGTAVLSLGEEIPGEEEQVQLGETGATVSIVTTSGREGLRATRIRIEGPSSGDGFIENLIIERTSVFGKIKLEDLKIQELFMKNVTVESN